MRKYEDFHVCPNGDYGGCAWGCTCDPGEGERVTATDDRDVMPLVVAARRVVDHPDSANFRNLLRAELKPFETEETR